MMKNGIFAVVLTSLIATPAVAGPDMKSPVEWPEKIYQLEPTASNYQKQVAMIKAQNQKSEFIMLNGVKNVSPKWAGKMLFDWSKDVDGCFYGAWKNDPQAKQALQSLADSVVKIQITTDFFLSDRYPESVSVKSINEHTELTREVLMERKSAYLQFGQAIDVCYSPKMMQLKMDMLRCNPEKEDCACFIPGKSGLAQISTDPSVDNQKICQSDVSNEEAPKGGRDA